MQRAFSFQVPRVERRFAMSDSDGRDFVFMHIAEKGFAEYEAPLPKLIVSSLARNPGTFVDVGANTGLYTILAAAVSPDIDVIAFEPLAEVFNYLKLNVELNEGFARRTRLVQSALSRAAGLSTFYQTTNDMGYLSTSSTLEERHASVIGGRQIQTQISAVALDEWVSANSSIKNLALMKIDAEGHEAAVMEGASNTISEFRPIITLEILANAELETLQNFLQDMRYVNLELEANCVRCKSVIAFNPNSWNHALCPLEKLYDFLASARAAELEIA